MMEKSKSSEAQLAFVFKQREKNTPKQAGPYSATSKDTTILTACTRLSDTLRSACALWSVGTGLQGFVGLATAALIAIRISLARLPAPIASVLAAMGTISYSLHLVHLPIAVRIINLGSRFATIGWQQLVLCLLAFALSCAARPGTPRPRQR